MLCVSGAGCKKKATPERLFKDMAKNGETIESISGKDDCEYGICGRRSKCGDENGF